jgi:hypothetical protein
MVIVADELWYQELLEKKEDISGIRNMLVCFVRLMHNAGATTRIIGLL